MKLWDSSLGLLGGNFVLLILIGAKWADDAAHPPSACPLRKTVGPTSREDLRYQESLDAAMEIFHFMGAQKTGKSPPKELDILDVPIQMEKCWNGYPLRPVEKDEDWASVEEPNALEARELYVFNAYADPRPSPLFPESDGIVQILSMVRRQLEDDVFCLLWIGDSREPTVVKSLYREIWQRAWDPRNRFYTPWIISCPVPASQPKPTHVSLSYSPCPKKLRNVRVVRGSWASPSASTRSGVAVCVKGLDFSGSDDWARLVEWVELQRLLGADAIVVYTYAVGTKTDKVLEYYERLGRLSRVPLSLPGHAPSHALPRSRYIWRNRQQKRRNEIIPYNDCLYRHLHSHRYILIVDTDEVIVPQPPLENWSELLEELEREEGPWTAYTAPNAFFFPNITKDFDPEIPEYLDMVRHNIRSSKISPAGSYGKSFVNVSSAATVFNHYPLHKQRPELKRTFYMKPSKAIKLHFKSTCPVESRDECPALYAQTRRDDSLLRFKDRLVQAVEKARKELKL